MSPWKLQISQGFSICAPMITSALSSLSKSQFLDPLHQQREKMKIWRKNHGPQWFIRRLMDSSKWRTWESKSWIWTVKTQRFFKIEHRNILDHWTLETEVESLKEQDRENRIMNVTTCTHVKVLEIELQEEEADGLILLPSFLHWKLSWSPSNKESDWFSFSKFSPFTIIMDLACKNRLTYLSWWFKVHWGCAPIPCASRVHH